MALKDNLLAYWKMEEASGTRVDAHGAFDLTDNNTVGSTTGKIGNCADFVAANSETLSIAGGVIGGGDDFTITFWVKFTNTGFHGLCDIAGDALFVGARATRIDLRMFNGGGYTDTFKTYTQATGTWYFVTVTFNSATGDATIDIDNSGSPATFDLGNTLYTGGGLGFLIGNDVAGYGCLNGQMDEFAIHERVLSGAELSEIYNGGAGLSYDLWDASTGNRRRRILLGSAT